MFVASMSWGQKTPSDYYEEGTKAQFHLDYQLALADFRYIVDEHPKNDLCSISYYHLGTIYARLGDSASAIQALRNSILCGSAETVPKFIHYFDNQYRIVAAHQLCEIYNAMYDVDSAVFYWNLYDSSFHGFSGCGNAAANDRDYQVVQFANIYLHAGRVAEGVNILLTRSFFRIVPQSAGDQKRYYTRAVQRLQEILPKQAQPTQLKAEIENAVSNFFFDTVLTGRAMSTDTAVYCCFTFQKAKVRFFYSDLSFYFVDESMVVQPANDRNGIIDQLKRSELYQMIESL